MTEAEWLICDDARNMLGWLPSASDRKLRLFAVACCRCSRQLLLNSDHRRAVDLAERFADGFATTSELTDAYRRTNELALRLHAGKSEREIRRWAEAVAVLNVTHLPHADAADAVWQIRRAAHRDINGWLAALLREVVGNPFQPINPPWLMSESVAPFRTRPQFARWYFDQAWRTSDTIALARQMYESRDFSAMPILADALRDSACDNEEILSHCLGSGPHVRGCWVVDLILGKS